MMMAHQQSCMKVSSLKPSSLRFHQFFVILHCAMHELNWIAQENWVPNNLRLFQRRKSNSIPSTCTAKDWHKLKLRPSGHSNCRPMSTPRLNFDRTKALNAKISTEIFVNLKRILFLSNFLFALNFPSVYMQKCHSLHWISNFNCFWCCISIKKWHSKIYILRHNSWFFFSPFPFIHCLKNYGRLREATASYLVSQRSVNPRGIYGLTVCTSSTTIVSKQQFKDELAHHQQLLALAWSGRAHKPHKNNQIITTSNSGW